ncbi:M64 family metallopeptidase [Actomonas aquatica]|uniref:M64 family metallopeptidase n=1 Tax=Actomonas aquatica TaxID=2866162 RepID=A0ABZ1C384_9BACT|nr:M64 family metallopeptidase [Opitutus sp. WL0086]WRQ85673.1 M64 family metallopeptidase [Opitutus sp. WL0086]
MISRIPDALRLLFLIGLTTAFASAQTATVRSLRDTGPSAQRINFVILGDGFTAAQENSFFTAAENAVTTLLTDEAFAPFADLINATAIFTASAEAGTTIPAENLAPDTYFRSTFSEGEFSRLVYIDDPTGRARVNDLLFTHTPDYDHVVMLVNTPRYGGGGGFPLCVTLHESTAGVLLHESGHSFAGLADEYVDEEIADDYPPNEYPNSTAENTRERLPWRRFVSDTTPVPTTESFSTDISIIGAFEGSYYRSTGYYRPVFASKMRDHTQPWGAVNLRAFANAVHQLDLNQAELPPFVANLSVPDNYTPGSPLVLSATAQGVGPFTYQWTKDNRFIIGQTDAALNLGNGSPSTYGTYTLEITNAAGTTRSRTVIVDASGARIEEQDTSGVGRLTNLSVRTLAGPASSPLTLGFTIDQGSAGATKELLVRAVGPGLAIFEVANYLGDPQLSIGALGSSDPRVRNDNWGGDAALSDAFTRVGAFPLDDPDSGDAAVLLSALQRPHTAQVTSTLEGISGITLVEVYDTEDQASPRLVNLSARAAIDPINPILVAGFVYAGDAPKRFLIRAIGPGLATYHVPDLLEDPQLVVRSLTTGQIVAANDNWAGSDELAAAFAAVGAFPLTDPDSTDAALIIELESGPYTATVSPTAFGFGTVLVEVYELP